MLLLLFVLFISCSFGISVPGYIVTAQYDCHGILCPTTSIDTVRVLTDLSYPFEKEQKVLNTLIPAANSQEMHFPLHTAYDPLSRNFYTAATGISGYSSHFSLLFQATLAKDLSSGPITASSNFTYKGGQLMSLESANGILYGIFSDGAVQTIRPTSGQLTMVGTLLPQGKGNKNRFASSATSVDAVGKRLFCLTRNAALGKDYELSVMNLATGQTQSFPLKPITNPPVYYDLENLFSISWIPTVQRLVVFATGNFDQLYYVDPTDGSASLVVYDLGSLGFKFRNSNSTFDSDLWKNDSFDSVSSNLYFQATVNEQFGATQLIHINFAPGSKPVQKTYVDQDAQWTFGNAGLKYVPCSGPCQPPVAAPKK